MRTLTADDIPAWVEEQLLAPDRTRPIVAVTSHPRAARGWVDPEELQRALGDLAEVVFLETGEATWALSEALPPRLDVYGGAMRVWWPGLSRESDPYDHRLYFAYSLDEAERRGGWWSTCVSGSVRNLPPPSPGQHLRRQRPRNCRPSRSR